LPGPVLLGLASIEANGGFRHGGFKTYGGDCPENISLKSRDLYVSLKDVTQSGDLLGAVSRVPAEIKSGRLTQDTVKLVFDGLPISREYLYWLLRTPDYREYCRGCGTGTTTLGLSRDDFLNYTVPPLTPADLVLVGLLEGVEKRITLLRETNATLEAIAQALFKSWFVDFDPVRAKQEGRAPERMDEATAALFPDAFDESELGLVPRGWGVAALDSVADFLNGLALQKFPPENDDDWLPVIKIAQLRKGDTSGADHASQNIKSEYIVQNGDVLFSWSGSLEVEVWCGGMGALNQHLFKVTSKNFAKWFYFLWTRYHLPHFQQIAAGKATTMGHIQRKHLTEAKVLVPPESLLGVANDAFDPLLNQLITNSLQAQTLATLRDTLLPRLISGQLRLPEAEAVLGEVAA
jgi:type I restriction enzyme S subunit